jgi:hypothetical protein
MNESERITRLERKLNATFAACTALIVVAVAASLNAQPGSRLASNMDVLRIRQLTIVDQKGTDRLILGAPLPDPLVNGRRVRRSGPISGIAVLDAKGNERGGFATGDASGEAFIGLDSEKSQEVLLLANPGGGSHLSIFDGNRNLARIGVLGGKPTLVVQQNGETILEQPPAR